MTYKRYTGGAFSMRNDWWESFKKKVGDNPQNLDFQDLVKQVAQEALVDIEEHIKQHGGSKLNPKNWNPVTWQEDGLSVDFVGEGKVPESCMLGAPARAWNDFWSKNGYSPVDIDGVL